MSKATIAGKTQPMKAGTNDFRKLEGKPPLKGGETPGNRQQGLSGGNAPGSGSPGDLLGDASGDAISS